MLRFNESRLVHEAASIQKLQQQRQTCKNVIQRCANLMLQAMSAADSVSTHDWPIISQSRTSLVMYDTNYKQSTAQTQNTLTGNSFCLQRIPLAFRVRKASSYVLYTHELVSS